MSQILEWERAKLAAEEVYYKVDWTPFLDSGNLTIIGEPVPTIEGDVSISTQVTQDGETVLKLIGGSPKSISRITFLATLSDTEKVGIICVLRII